MARIRNRRLVAASVVGGVLAGGLGTTLALWSAQDSTALALHGARHAFQAHHLEGAPQSIQVTDPDVLDLTIQSSTILDQLHGAGSAYIPFRVYGAVEGGGAMTYGLTEVDGGVLAEKGRATLWRVDDAATQCSASVEKGTRVYPARGSHGPFRELALFDRLVAPGGPERTETGRHDYCLELRLLGSRYENTATATGETSDGVEVDASGSWDATFVPDVPEDDMTTLTFERQVGREVDRGPAPEDSAAPQPSPGG